ncbi:inositol polyphosphate multikinase [Scaptodrosophila lebanonensis]|uniref:Kinase n=1 Tax=Drosophila lebanonensis TaxID=7225 RepID=A0A6J2U6V3_DROLE|nr:inositol polyphosphate multikinase [Scaptodrosophila lebanonensis]
MAKNEQVIELPTGFRQLHTQVAGHTFEATNLAAIGLLQDAKAGCVLKPLGKPECGVRELHFYESVAAAAASATADNDRKGGGGDDRDKWLIELSQYVPRYHKKVELVVNQRKHTFVKLDDLTHGMLLPCIMDIKIGKRTWDPMSSPHKRALEEQKYVECKQNLGLCLPGFQVYLPSSETTESPKKHPELKRYGKDYGKSLNVAGFKQTMALFFNASTSNSKTIDNGVDIVLHEVLRQLENIHGWFRRQTLLHFYASSLLISYDFAQLQHAGSKSLHNGYFRKEERTDISSDMEPSEWIRVRMIDFAHVYPASPVELDHNYLFGLENLINVIQSILNR